MSTTRQLPAKLGKKAPKGWSVDDLWPFLKDVVADRDKCKKKVGRLADEVEELSLEQARLSDPRGRLVFGLAETGAAAGGGFLNPFLVKLLGPEWQKVDITDDFGVDVEAISAGAVYGLGLFLHWRDYNYGKWVFEAGKGAVASYAGHVGRELGAHIALPEKAAAA